MKEPPPVMKPEHADAPLPTSSVNNSEIEPRSGNFVVRLIKPVIAVAGGAVIVFTIRQVGKLLIPRRYQTSYRPSPQPPHIVLLPDEPLDADTPPDESDDTAAVVPEVLDDAIDVDAPPNVPAVAPPAAAPSERLAALAMSEWIESKERQATLDDEIELLDDPSPPTTTPLAVSYGRAPVLHAYRHRALESARRHAREYPRQEVGGLLLGVLRETAKGQPVTIVTGIVRADTAIGSAASVQFTPPVWVATLAIRDRHPIYSDEKAWQIVGWYHTHPGFGIFLSSLDVHFHQTFRHPGHLALVIDPSKTGAEGYGTFGWDRDQTQPVRLPMTSRSEQWKTELDEQQTLALLNRSGIILTELPPDELKADPTITVGQPHAEIAPPLTIETTPERPSASRAADAEGDKDID
jgi:proteasome lid subunit RPN8/RPN11